jgi:hypothetical protein
VAESRTLGSGAAYLVLRPAPFVQGGFEVVDGKEVVTDE